MPPEDVYVDYRALVTTRGVSHCRVIARLAR